MDLAKLGLPAYDEDGDLTTSWYDPKELVGGLLEGTEGYNKLKADIRDYHHRKANPSPAKDPEQNDGEDDDDNQLLENEQKELDAAKIAEESLSSATFLASVRYARLL